MHFRFPSFIALAILIIGTAPQLARAAERPNPACGTSIEENLTAAEHALQSGDEDSRKALACLINATAQLNGKLNDYETGKSSAQAWHPPITDLPIKPGQ